MIDNNTVDMDDTQPMDVCPLCSVVLPARQRCEMIHDGLWGWWDVNRCTACGWGERMHTYLSSADNQADYYTTVIITRIPRQGAS